MQRITVDEALQLSASVCTAHDPLQDSINPAFPFRGIFFPTDGCSLFPQQWKSVFAATLKLGRPGIVVLPTELPVEEWDSVGCWLLEDEASYFQLQKHGIFALQNTIIDRESTWVIELSDEYHALIGSTFEFGRELANHYQLLSSECQNFIQSLPRRKSSGDEADWAAILAAKVAELACGVAVSNEA